MKNIFFLFFFCLGNLAFAQSHYKSNTSTTDNSFQQGNIVVSAGYGVGTVNLAKVVFDFITNVAEVKVQNFNFKTSGPFFIKGEYAITDNIGIGLNIATISNNTSDFIVTRYKPDTVTFKARAKQSNTSILLRGNFYFINQEQFQMYGGLGIGVRVGKYTISGSVDEFNKTFSFPFVFPVGFDATLGARYFFIPNLGVYAEMGASKGFLQFGLSGKF